MPTDYAGMNAVEIAGWVLIATAAGWTARTVVKGKKFFGLWGDMVIGLVGVFLLALLLKQILGVNLAERLRVYLPADFSAFAVWLDIAITAFLGALVIRAVLRPFTGGGGGGGH
jgi:uncharacterized membrane protein YeaQ/YmgE (transglycosylase-associated protein family)